MRLGLPRPARFLVDEDGRLRVVGRATRTAMLTFFEDGLRVHGDEPGVLLPWDDCYAPDGEAAEPEDSWGITFFMSSGTETGIGLYLTGRHEADARPLYEETMPLRRRTTTTLDAVYLNGSVLPVAMGGAVLGTVERERTTLAVLCEVLARRPALRPRLESPERMAPLAAAMTRRPQPDPPRFEPVTADAHDIRGAVAAAGLAFEFGRPLSRREAVPFDEAVSRARAALAASPRRPDRPVNERKLYKLVRRLCTDLDAWPFDALVAD